METSAGQGEHGTGKSVKGSIRKIPSESMIRLWRNFFVMADYLVQRLEESEPISDLENLVRIILVWCGKQDLNLHEIAFTRT